MTALFTGVAFITSAQQADTVAIQEPAASQQVILYAMTAVGVILIGLAFRNSKWGRGRKK